MSATIEPSNGWTGGAFSALRVGVALIFLARWAMLGPAVAGGAVTVGVGVLVGAWLALGLRTRVAAAACATCLALVLMRDAGLRSLPEIALLLLSVTLVLAPPAPFGSLEARGRVDPRGGWRLPGRVLRGTRLGAIAALVLFPPGFHAWDVLAVLLLLFAALDPAWIRARGERPSLAFYDGSCGLCHATVRFLLAEDRRGSLRFAPLQGTTIREHLSAEQVAELPDAMALVTGDGELCVGAAAVLRLLEELGGLWRIVATALGLVPSFLLDAGYRTVARVRRRVFRAPNDACPLATPELSARFLP